MTELEESEKRILAVNQIVILVILVVLSLLQPFSSVFGLISLLLPGFIWAGSAYLWGEDAWTAEALFLSLAGSLAMLLTLVLLDTFLQTNFPMLVLLLLVSVNARLTQHYIWRIPAEVLPGMRKDWSRWGWFLLPLAIALILRLPWFGYREIQGDEGIVLVRAADALLGDGVELLLHRKGPMEILLSMGMWGLLGEINDVWVRLPFLLCNLFSLAIFYRLSERWFGRQTAVLATSLFAIVGFHVAFSRVVQYQSLVMMWGLGAVLAAERYRAEGRRVDLTLASGLLAAGLLSHYDAILFAPASLTLLLCRWISKRHFPWREVALATAIGTVMLALFYVPFVLGPDFQNTLGYLLNERVGTDSGGSLGDVWQMVTFYNSSWFIVGVSGFAVAGLISLWFKWQDWMVRFAAVLLFLAPFLFYIGIVSVPRTHVYTFFPGLTLLAAVGLVKLAEVAQSRSTVLLRLGQVGFGLWFVICASYIWLLFSWGPGEVQRNWESARPNSTLFWTTWDEPPKFGLFGFPYQAGWRNLGQADLEGLVYASNEEEEITNWYMAQADRTHCGAADLFLLAENVQDEVAFASDILQRSARQTIGNGLYGYGAVTELGGRKFTPEEISKPRTFDGIRLDVPLGEQVSLAGYRLLENDNGVEVVLYWDVHQYFNRNFQAFVHAVDADGNLVTQHDSAPECGINPTTRWEPGTLIRDPHSLVLPTGQPVQLMAGMYDLITQERLPVDGEPGNFVLLTDYDK